VVKFWAPLIKRFLAPVMVVTVSAVAVQHSLAAPIYDMQGFLGQTHPFLQPVPPLAAPQNVPDVPVTRPGAPQGTKPFPSASPPAPQPVSGPGPMRLPSSFEGRSGQGGGARNIKWQKSPAGSKTTTSDPAPYKSNSFLSEIRIGALVHDEGPFSSNKEEGYDANLEFLFASPGIFNFMWSPRPHVGVTYNAYGDTSQAYLGLTWEWDFLQHFFAGFSLGATVHDGKTTSISLDKKELGCRVLFRESVTLGFRITKHHSLMAFLDHASNASLCDRNEGLETFGIRYGYRF